MNTSRLKWALRGSGTLSGSGRAEHGSKAWSPRVPHVVRPMSAPVVADESYFLAVLPLIDDVVSHVCRTRRMSHTDAEDFRSEARLHFVENDYQVLGRFQGLASLETYLTVVIQNLFVDLHGSVFGRWRPSRQAKNRGPVGELLERLIVRDGCSTEQALEMTRVNHGVVVDDDLRAFCDKLARRGPLRRFVDEEQAGEIASDGPSPEAIVLRAEGDFLAKRIHDALDRARQQLAPIEGLIIRMRYEDRMSVASIARALRIEQRPLYRTIERLRGLIRERMASEGISRKDIQTLLADGEFAGALNGRAGASTHSAQQTRASWPQDR